MQENTKTYLKNLVDDLEIQLNTISSELSDAFKTKRKLQKFIKKIK